MSVAPIERDADYLLRRERNRYDDPERRSKTLTRGSILERPRVHGKFLFVGAGLRLQLFFALKQRKVAKENSSQTRFAPRVLTARAHPHPILLLDYKEKGQSRWFVAD